MPPVRRKPAPRSSARRRPSNKPRAIRPVGESPFVNLLIYGHPGSQKTRFIGTGPKETLIIAPPTDHRDSIRGVDMEEWVVRSWTEMNEALDYLRDNQGAGYKWVWLDSISLFQQAGLDDIWEDTVLRRPERGKYGLDKGEYGINMFRLSSWVRHLVGARIVNVGITAHPFEMDNPFEEDEDKIGPLLMPYIQGKNMATSICGYMNMVGYMRPAIDKRTKKRRIVLSVELTERWYGKDQFYAFPDGRLVDPTIPKLMAAIERGGSTRSSGTATRTRRKGQ